ncbi:MAG: membrane protein insertase YidC [Sphingobacteriales bacterium]|nr:MAG: membrane protein insertase YidC [Sphingobacteriales bacterium]
MDRNQIIGFSLLLVLLAAYVGWNSKTQKEYQTQKQKQATADSIAYAKAHPRAAVPLPVDSTVATVDTAVQNALPPALRQGAGQEVVLENADVALTFSTRGAKLINARLKNYKTFGGQPLDLFSGTNNGLAFTLPYDNGRSTADLLFAPAAVAALADGTKAIDFVADLGGGKRVDLIYSLPQEQGMAQLTIRATGLNASALPFTWNVSGRKTERDVTVERQNAQVYHQYKDGDGDYFTIREAKEETYKENLQWMGFRKHYFSTALLSDDGFNRGVLKADVPKDSATVAVVNAKGELPLRNGEGRLRWYIGPNKYKVLKSYKIGLDDMVPLGSGLVFFVRYINKGIIIPVFNFLHDNLGIMNMGVIIMLLTLFIRLILSFFTYKSYLSSAKMRVLKPEIDQLREEHKDNQQALSMEQMKLYRTAGVNPLGGCLPMLFQLPILIAMYSFFPSAIELRQKSFLWAPDLSTYDSVLDLPFTIPFYGDHVSLFTILMTVSSLMLALYNRNMTPQDPNNPLLKWMPFIFPFLLLGVFNKMAAALTFYYFFANVVALVQQFLIQKVFINETKIHAQIKENRNKPAQQSKWAQRLEEMQKAQAERAKQPPRRK